jgi:oxaloacetate decarboxylase alpha subunit
MLTNMEGQLKEQNAIDKFDEVLAEIPKVREDLGYIPLVTPTSQIVGTQAVLNVLTGERYKSISKETAAILKGEYGAAPASMNKELQDRVLDGKEVMTCRPADKIEPEMDKLTTELEELAKEKDFKLAEREVDDVLTYALFPQIGLKFLENRDNPEAFEPVPSADDMAPAKKASGPETYTVEVNGQQYVVAVSEGGEISQIESQGGASAPAGGSAAPAPAAGEGEPVTAPLSGNIWKIEVSPGDTVEEGDVLIILEAMKMETEVRASKAGTIGEIFIKVGDTVAVDDEMLTIA